MLNVTPVTPWIHRLTVPFSTIYTTVGIISTDEGVVIFDTATYQSDVDRYIVPALAQLEIPGEHVKYVVISHDHGDHAGGLERFMQLFPQAQIAAGSEACAERVLGKTVRVLKDGEGLLGPLEAVSIPGHTIDCTGILDTRTGTLLSGDCLQQYGIYGPGKWGANIGFPLEHLAAIERLRNREISAIVTSHDYHPFGYRAKGAEEIGTMLDYCAGGLLAVRDFIKDFPMPDDEEMVQAYNSQSGLPTVPAKVVKALREAIDEGKI